KRERERYQEKKQKSSIQSSNEIQAQAKRRPEDTEEDAQKEECKEEPHTHPPLEEPNTEIGVKSEPSISMWTWIRRKQKAEKPHKYEEYLKKQREAAARRHAAQKKKWEEEPHTEAELEQHNANIEAKRKRERQRYQEKKQKQQTNKSSNEIQAQLKRRPKDMDEEEHRAHLAQLKRNQRQKQSSEKKTALRILFYSRHSTKPFLRTLFLKIQHLVQLSPVVGTYGLGVKLPPWQAIPPPPTITLKQAQKKGAGKQKETNASPFPASMLMKQAEVLALLSSKEKKGSSTKTALPSKTTTRAESNLQEKKAQKQKAKSKDEKVVTRQSTPDEGGKTKSKIAAEAAKSKAAAAAAKSKAIAEAAKMKAAVEAVKMKAAAEAQRKKERKQAQQEMEESSGNWVPLGEYYYGKMEGDPTYKETKGEFRFKCWYCNKMLFSNLAAMLHIQGHIDSEKQVNLDLNDLTSCKHCYKSFNTPFEMQTHIEKVHTNKANNLLCRICEKDHDSRHSLREHMRRNHNACEMPYICQLCKFRSSMYSDVVDHFKKKHSNTSSLLCLYCLKTFSVRSNNQGWGQTLNYYNHLLKHQIKNCTKKCQLCKLVFHSAPALKAHRQTEHLPNQKGVMGMHKKQSASDEVMIKIAGDTAGLGSGTGRSSRSAGGGGSAGVIGTFSPSVSSVRSLNVPAVKKFLEHRIIIPANALKARCVECNRPMGEADHYKKYMMCSMCRYASSCTHAYSTHMLGFHSGQESAVAALNIPADRPMTKELYCECGFSTLYGNKLANHLVSCSKSTCYKHPPPTSSGDNFGTELQDPRKKPDACLLDVLGLVKKDSLALYTSKISRPETPPQQPVEMPEVDEVARPARRPSLLMDAKKSLKSLSLKEQTDPPKPDNDLDPSASSAKLSSSAEKLQEDKKEPEVKSEEGEEKSYGGKKLDKKEVRIVEKTDGDGEEKIEEKTEENKQGEGLKENLEHGKTPGKISDQVQSKCEDSREMKSDLAVEGKDAELKKDGQEKKENEVKEEKDGDAKKEESRPRTPSDKENNIDESTQPESLEIHLGNDNKAKVNIDHSIGPEFSTEQTAKDNPSSEKSEMPKGSLVDYDSDSVGETSYSGPDLIEAASSQSAGTAEKDLFDSEDSTNTAEIKELGIQGTRNNNDATMEGEDESEKLADAKEELDGSQEQKGDDVEIEEGNKNNEDETRTNKEADASTPHMAYDESSMDVSGEPGEGDGSSTLLNPEINASSWQAVPMEEAKNSLGEIATEEENTGDSNVGGDNVEANANIEKVDSTSGTSFPEEDTTNITNEEDSGSASLKTPGVETGRADQEDSRKISQSFNGNFNVSSLNSLGEGSCDARDWTGKFPNAESSHGDVVVDGEIEPSLAGALSVRVFEKRWEDQGDIEAMGLERSPDVSLHDQASLGEVEEQEATSITGEHSVSPSEAFDKDEEEEEKETDLEELERDEEKCFDTDSQDQSNMEGAEHPTELRDDSVSCEKSSLLDSGRNLTEPESSASPSKQKECTESNINASSQGGSCTGNTLEISTQEKSHETGASDEKSTNAREEVELPQMQQKTNDDEDCANEDISCQERGKTGGEIDAASIASSEIAKDSVMEQDSGIKGYGWGSGAENFVPESVGSMAGVKQSSARPSTSRSSVHSGEGHRERSRSQERRRSRSRDRRSRSRDRRSRSRSRDRQRERDRDRRRERERHHHRDRDRDRYQDREGDRHRDRRDRSRDRDRRDRSRDRERDRRDRSRDRDRRDRSRERDRRDRSRERDRRDRDHYSHRDDRKYR
ncbi:Pogo transposable element with ZNF domain, partial [Elysia marginata]